MKWFLNQAEYVRVFIFYFHRDNSIIIALFAVFS